MAYARYEEIKEKEKLFNKVGLDLGHNIPTTLCDS